MNREATAEPLVRESGVKNSTCRHTLYHVDARGVLQGTWQAVDVGKRQRIDCRVCGRFFAYRK